MKKLLLLLIALPFLMACEKEEPPTEVTFTLNISGFEITAKEFGGLKSTQVDFDSFEHKYQSGTLTFINSAGVIYTFGTGANSIENFSITLPTGTYDLSGVSGEPDRFGAGAMSLTIESQEIIIEPSTAQIDVAVTPTCALLLIADENSLVESADIKTRPISTDGIFWYSYFKPYDYSAHIYKKDGAMLTISTGNLQIGYIYQIEVTDSGTTQDINLNPSFTKDIPVIW